VSAEEAHLPVLTRFLQRFWSAGELPPEQAPAFELALEEVFMNVVLHGAPRADATPRVEMSLMLADGSLAMTIEDDGPQFDPLTLPPPELTGSVAERPVGGLGVFLVRKMMDTVNYQRVGARNQLRMTKHIGSA
jgi:anti-sigma regulatory factor (Ser/Thr protein kinase)